MKPKPPKNPFICSCNGVPQSEVEAAIQQGCFSLSQIGDLTTAGVGACGGTCRPLLLKMINYYQDTGQFLENPKPPRKKK